MTEKSTPKTDPQRTRIKQKIAASQDRLKREGAAKLTPRKTAKPAAQPEGLLAAAAEYPFLSVFGGIAAGAVIGALLPKALGGKLVRRSVALATVAGELGMVYGKSALEKAGEVGHEAQERLGDAVKSLDEGTADARARAVELASEAGTRASHLAGEAFSATRDTSTRLAGSTRDAGLDIARKVIKLLVEARRR